MAIRIAHPKHKSLPTQCSATKGKLIEVLPGMIGSQGIGLSHTRRTQRNPKTSPPEPCWRCGCSVSAGAATQVRLTSRPRRKPPTPRRSMSKTNRSAYGGAGPLHKAADGGAPAVSESTATRPRVTPGSQHRPGNVGHLSPVKSSYHLQIVRITENKGCRESKFVFGP